MFFKSLWLTAMFAATLFLVACEESPTDPDVVEAPNAPTAIMATSKSETAISVKWTASATGAVPTGYILVIADDGGANASEITISDPSTVSVDVPLLTKGNVYQMYVLSVNDTARSTPSATIKWAPAKRYIANLRIYETESDLGSGIELPETAGLTIAEGNRWDICLDTRDNVYDIGAPNPSSYLPEDGQTFRITGLGKIWSNVTSLDQIYEAVSFTDPQNPALAEKLINFNAEDTKGEGFAFVVRTTSHHFAKVLVKASGSPKRLLQGTAPDRYLELEVSYQSGADIPYAVTTRNDDPTLTKKSTKTND